MILTRGLGEVYLDHTGTTLFPRLAIDNFAKDITSNLYGNPHSESPSSRLSTVKIEEVRLRALQFFNASPDDYDLVFVQNATAAIKLVSEVMQSHSEAEGGFWYGYHGDSHTSVVGIREVAKAGYTCFDSDRGVNYWIDYGSAEDAGRTPPARLFAYPGQSNMTGRRLPLSWPGRIRRSALNSHGRTYTLLDAAALASTAELDLSRADDAPDFVALSFYKIFGFPDLGALLVRRELGPMLRGRKYFGGGTVEMVLNGMQWHSLHTEHPHEFLEDGTLPFHNIIALGHALTAHERLYTSQKHVSRHTARLAKYMYDNMTFLKHADGSPVCVIYKDSTMVYGDSSSTGSTIAFNIRYADGSWVKLDDIEALAKQANIHLRTGGVCNPGGIAKSLDLAPWEFVRNYVAGTRCGHGPVVLGGKPSGIARVSLGAMSNTKDVDALIEFLRGKFRNALPERTTPTEWEEGTGLPVTGIMIYPLEGAGAWRVPRDVPWPVEDSGLRWDKDWFVVDLKENKILTRETAPKLLLLTCEVDVDDGAFRVTTHKSLGTATPGDTHLSLPLGGDMAGMMQPAGGEDLRMSTRSVTRGDASFLASVCMSENVVAFFSVALGTRCTVARAAKPELPSTKHVQSHLESPPKTVLVQNVSQPYSQPAQQTGSSDTLVSSSHTSSTLENGFPRSLEEALAESMEGNIILARHSGTEDSVHEHNWLFLSVGHRHTEVHDSYLNSSLLMLIGVRVEGRKRGDELV